MWTNEEIRNEISRLEESNAYHNACVEINAKRIAQLTHELEQQEFKMYLIHSCYSVEDISKLLKVNEETVRRWIRKHELNAFSNSKKEGYYINKKDFEKFLIRHNKYRKQIHGET